jgi:hypothetical protein
MLILSVGHRLIGGWSAPCFVTFKRWIFMPAALRGAVGPRGYLPECPRKVPEVALDLEISEQTI